VSAGLAVVCLTLVLFRCYFGVIPPYFGGIVIPL